MEVINATELEEKGPELGGEYEKALHDTPTEDEIYKRYREDQGIPVHNGLFIEDLDELETGYWDWTEQYGAFVNLYGQKRLVDLQLEEIEPGGETRKRNHFFDKITLVIRGNGITEIGDQQFEWKEHSLFYTPVNAPYKHINVSDDEPAKLISHTYLPQLMNMIKDLDIIFDNEYDALKHERDYSGSEGIVKEFEWYKDKYDDQKVNPVAWDAYFVPDIFAIEEMRSWDRIGQDKKVYFPFPESGLYSHMSELSVGTYKNLHKHGPQAQIFTLGGDGYELLWPDGGDVKIKLDWGPRTVYAPPTHWWHTHFNLSSEPSRLLALSGPRTGCLNQEDVWDGFADWNIRDYYEEDPGIRELFEGELAERGLESSMPEKLYTQKSY